MNTLIQQFATKVFAQHNININDNNFGRLSFNNFSNWIKSQKKLFRSYYSAFRTDLW